VFSSMRCIPDGAARRTHTDPNPQVREKSEISGRIPAPLSRFQREKQNVRSEYGKGSLRPYPARASKQKTRGEVREPYYFAENSPDVCCPPNHTARARFPRLHPASNVGNTLSLVVGLRASTDRGVKELDV